MTVQAKEGMAHGALSCLLPCIHQQWPLGPWVEQCSGTMGMGAAKLSWYSVCVMNVLSQRRLNTGRERWVK